MNISLVIEQLRQYCPALGGRVAGAANFDTGIEAIVNITDPVTGGLVYPVAVVIPYEDEVSGNSLAQGDLQTVTETIGVIVEFDSSADRRGQTAVSQVDDMKYSIFKAILNWHIDLTRSAKGIYYAGGSLLKFDRARLFWEYRFSFDALISDADGFPLEGFPLSLVTGTIPGDTADTPPVVFDVQL